MDLTHGTHPYRRARLHPPAWRCPRRDVVRRVLLLVGILGTWLFAWCAREARPTRPREATFVRWGAVPRPGVVNVWLQGCLDCAPAFDAARRIDEDHGWDGLPVANVALGAADPAWARAHGVGHGLVVDRDGARVVTPLGIGTFTTLVLDRQGRVVARDRPDAPGFLPRITTALAKAR